MAVWRPDVAVGQYTSLCQRVRYPRPRVLPTTPPTPLQCTHSPRVLSACIVFSSALVHRYSRQFKVPRSTVVFKPADASAAGNAYFHTNNWDEVISKTAYEHRGVPESWVHRRVLLTTRQVLLHPPPVMARLCLCQKNAGIRCRQEEIAGPRTVYRNL